MCLINKADSLRYICLTWLLWMLGALAAWGQSVTSINYSGQEVSFELSGDTSAKVFTIGDDKPRIVIDFPKASLNMDGKTLAKGPQVFDGQGGVKRVRFAAREAGMRAVLDLEAGARFKSHRMAGSKLIVKIGGLKAQRASAASTASRYFGKATPYPRLAPRRVPKVVRKPVIVIDPGHGGRDPGAIGKKGTRESVITTASAKELQRQLLATGRYTVILTRRGDIYVDHEERLRIARAGGADLFISIHADSAGNSSARGASVYTLADRAKNRSKRIVNSQNWILDVDLTEQSDPVGDILVDLAQRKTSSQSEKFADVLIGELEGSTALIGNSHRRAGYFVLLAPDVPAVLLEMGFLSNSSDEKLLNSAAHRKKVLRSVTRAINTYFKK